MRFYILCARTLVWGLFTVGIGVVIGNAQVFRHIGPMHLLGVPVAVLYFSALVLCWIPVIIQTGALQGRGLSGC